MSEQKCIKCGGLTKSKFITSKKDGKQYKIFECLDCKNEKGYAFSFFPPRDKEVPKPTVSNNNQIIDVLNEMKALLCSINSKLSNISKKDNDREDFIE